MADFAQRVSYQSRQSGMPCSSGARRWPGANPLRSPARTIRAPLLPLAVVALLASVPSDAEAQLKMCNKTTFEISVAVATPQGADWMSRGWFNIKPGDCANVIGDILWNQYYYYYAFGNQGKSEWTGPVGFCVHPRNTFNIVGRENCTERKYERRGFVEIDTRDAREWTIQFDPARS